MHSLFDGTYRVGSGTAASLHGARCSVSADFSVPVSADTTERAALRGAGMVARAVPPRARRVEQQLAAPRAAGDGPQGHGVAARAVRRRGAGVRGGRSACALALPVPVPLKGFGRNDLELCWRAAADRRGSSGVAARPWDERRPYRPAPAARFGASRIYHNESACVGVGQDLAEPARGELVAISERVRDSPTSASPPSTPRKPKRQARRNQGLARDQRRR